MNMEMLKKRLHYKTLVEEDLESASFSLPDDQQGIVKEALQICKRCDHKNPGVFRFLEENKTRVG